MLTRRYGRCTIHREALVASLPYKLLKNVEHLKQATFIIDDVMGYFQLFRQQQFCLALKQAIQIVTQSDHFYQTCQQSTNLSLLSVNLCIKSPNMLYSQLTCLDCHRTCQNCHLSCSHIWLADRLTVEADDRFTGWPFHAFHDSNIGSHHLPKYLLRILRHDEA